MEVLGDTNKISMDIMSDGPAIVLDDWKFFDDLRKYCILLSVFEKKSVLTNETQTSELSKALDDFIEFVTKENPPINVQTAYPHSCIQIILNRVLHLDQKFASRSTNPNCHKGLYLGLSSFLYGKSIPQDALDIAALQWKIVNNKSLDLFLRLFKIGDKIDKKELAAIVKDMVSEQRYAEATRIIKEIKLYEFFNIPILITTLINEDKLTEATALATEDVELQKSMVNVLVDRREATKAATIIQKFKLNPEDFPEVVDVLEKNCLRHWAHEQDWIQIEEKFWNHKKILSNYVTDLVNNNEMDIALSITTRHKLLSENFFTAPIRRALIPFFQGDSNIETFTYKENTLFAMDKFMPTEELLGLAPRGTFLNFNRYNMELDRDIIYIDNDNSKKFDDAEVELRNAKVIGFDSEFMGAFTKFGDSTLCLIQLATPEKVFLFDCIALAKSITLPKLLADLFSNPNIVIIAHTIRSDLAELRRTFNFSDSNGLKIENSCEIETAFKKLHPEAKKTSLAEIIATTWKITFSKYEQVSNWKIRPLRRSQMHYAALDAYVLVKLYFEFKERLEIEVKLS